MSKHSQKSVREPFSKQEGGRIRRDTRRMVIAEKRAFIGR